MRKVKIEVCVDSVASAVAAEHGGADRIELCGSLAEGGITPSAGLIEAARSIVSLDLHVMIRPRGSDFCYDEQEFQVMQRDIELAKQMGADGVVFGILKCDGAIDVQRTRQLVDLARPLAVTFHRAFDMSADLFQSLEDVCRVGADRVLTSGGEQTSLQGIEPIASLVTKAQERIIIMPGSGIKPENARDLVERTGAKEIHVGLRSSVLSSMLYRNARVALGTVAGTEYDRFAVLEDNVRKLRETLNHAS